MSGERDVTSGDEARLPVVAVYREVILYYNEPYIRTQAEAVPRYRSYYVGTHRPQHSIDLPPDRTLVLRDRYQRLDSELDRLFTRVPPWGPLRQLAYGSVVGRATESVFIRSGISPHMVKRLRELSPVLLHAHTGVSGAHALPLVRRLGVPFVVTFHGYDATANDAELNRWATRGRIFLRRRDAMKQEVSRVIAVSGFIRDLLLDRGWPSDRVVVHYMGVDTELFQPDPAAKPLADREPIVFFAGRLIEKKGLRYLIDAMRVVQTRVPEAQVVIAGHGEQRAQLERRAAEAGVRVQFTGSVSPDAVRAWMSRAQIYCMPSVRAEGGDSEGLPTAVVEAMSCGLPVVATTHAGIPEAVAHGQTGLLAPERDPGTLAAHLITLLTDAKLRERMGAAGRERVLDRFDHRKQAVSLASIYDEVCAERAAVPSPPRA
jgi:colanic acid/amylovoran biosynthesis glycosyltransferase